MQNSESKHLCLRLGEVRWRGKPFLASPAKRKLAKPRKTDGSWLLGLIPSKITACTNLTSDKVIKFNIFFSEHDFQYIQSSIVLFHASTFVTLLRGKKVPCWKNHKHSHAMIRCGSESHNTFSWFWLRRRTKEESTAPSNVASKFQMEETNCSNRSYSCRQQSANLSARRRWTRANPSRHLSYIRSYIIHHRRIVWCWMFNSSRVFPCAHHNQQPYLS